VAKTATGALRTIWCLASRSKKDLIFLFFAATTRLTLPDKLNYRAMSDVITFAATAREFVPSGNTLRQEDGANTEMRIGSNAGEAVAITANPPIRPRNFQWRGNPNDERGNSSH